DMAFRPHSQQVDIEIRYRPAGFGVGGQDLLVGQCRGGQIAAELTVTGGHRVHVARRDVDVVEQCSAGLLVVALVVVFGNVALVAPEQMHACPVDPLTVHAELTQQRDAVAAAGEHDQCPAPGRYGRPDGVDQSFGGGIDQGRAIGEDFDDGTHTYCTFLMPSSAA